jgi:hypothetical protein
MIMLMTTISVTTLLTTALLSAAPLSLRPQTARGESVAWHEGGFAAAASQARTEGKPLLIALLPDWSDYSRKMTAETLVDPAVTHLLADMVCLKFEQEDDSSLKVAQRYSVTSFPTLVIAAPDGTIDDVVIGFFPPGPLVTELQRIASGRNTLRDHLQRVADAPDDLAVRYAYAVKLDELGDRAGYQRELDAIQAADPNGDSFIGNVILQQGVWSAIAAASPGGEATYDLTPIRDFLEGASQTQALFQGWTRVADFEAERERSPEAVDAYRKVLPHVPENQMLDWSNDTANFVLERTKEDLPPEAGDFAIQLAQGVVKRAVALGKPDADGNIGYPGDDYDVWLAGRFDLLTRCHMQWPDASRIKSALKTCRRSIALDPGNTEYKARLAVLKQLR